MLEPSTSDYHQTVRLEDYALDFHSERAQSALLGWTIGEAIREEFRSPRICRDMDRSRAPDSITVIVSLVSIR
jgi:hypothetical protein